jgi:uncharacterized Zn finger protein
VVPGSTWWGRRWLEALEQVVDPSRRSQGRWHARSGRVVRLEIEPGAAVARLEGGQAVPRDVTLRLPTIPDAHWEPLISALAAEARFEAALLAADLPPEIEEGLNAAGLSLFPRPAPVTQPPPRRPSRTWGASGWGKSSGWGASGWGASSREQSGWWAFDRDETRRRTLEAGDLTLSCTCSDARTQPCKHIAATGYALAARLDADPLLLFTLRGRPPAELLPAIRARRAGEALDATYDAIAGLAARFVAEHGQRRPS